MTNERSPSGLTSLEADYEIIREIGRGGTAIVYLARERATDREVAIKLIRAKYLEDEEAVARFAREARFVAQLNHPNVVPVHAVLDLGQSGIALVMAHVEGRTLKQLIQEERPLEPERVLNILRDVAGALGAAHARGIIHRDVKPENIFVDGEGRALLADFGVARSMSGDTQLTMHGVAIGTPAYMAPEQIDGGELDGRGDVYSLGLVAWEMFTGHRPWEGESLYAVLYHQRHHELPDVRDMRPDVPDEIADVIAGAIEKEPSARWQTMEELIAALDGSAPSRRAIAHVPVSTETMRFVRPLTPAPSSPNIPVLGAAAGAAPDAAPTRTPPPLAPALARAGFTLSELEDAPPPPRRIAPSRRQMALAGAGLVAAILIALVGNAVEGRSDEQSTLPPAGETRTASSGEVGRVAPPAAAVAPTVDSTLATPNASGLPDSLTVASAIGATTTPGTPAGAESASADGRLAVTLQPTPTTPRPAPPAQPAAQTPVARAGGSARAMPTPPERLTAVPPPSLSVSTAIGPPPPRSRVSIVAGGVHTCLIGPEGRAYCWGGNDRGQLGIGQSGRTGTPMPIGVDLRFTTMAPGLAHSCAIARGGALWCWGENDRGQLGDRSTTARSAPVRSAVGHAFRTVAAGAAHTCGVEIEGDAWCWGADSFGQLGDGGSADRSAPVAVAGGQRFSSIDVGWNFTCGLVGGGTAMCWGDNAAGQLGDGSTIVRRVPVKVQGDIAFRAITAGNAHACGVTERGEAYCWGRNASGELGDGSSSQRSTPVRVRGGERFVSIAAGAVHTCAVTGEGEAWCWGRNTYGQLGNGGTTDSNQPVRVAGGHTFTTVRAFGSHTCGATSSGEAFCWGYNLEGQLGDGTRTHRTRPVYVERPTG